MSYKRFLTLFGLDGPYSYFVEIQVRLAADGVLAAVGAERKEVVAAWTADKKQVSPYALTLQQLQNGVKVPPTGWTCSKCDKTENLWMNLTDGTILCGRRNWDGTGGNNHALEHYQATNYPLAVKLGTITADLEGAGNFVCFCICSLLPYPKLTTIYLTCFLILYIHKIFFPPRFSGVMSDCWLSLLYVTLELKSQDLN